jgi:hypothetical protein
MDGHCGENHQHEDTADTKSSPLHAHPLPARRLAGPVPAGKNSPGSWQVRRGRAPGSESPERRAGAISARNLELRWLDSAWQGELRYRQGGRYLAQDRGWELSGAGIRRCDQDFRCGNFFAGDDSGRRRRWIERTSVLQLQEHKESHK